VAEQTSEKQGGSESGQNEKQSTDESAEGQREQGQQGDGQQDEGKEGSGTAKAGAGAGALAFLKRGRRPKEGGARRTGRNPLAGGLTLLGRLIALVLSILAAIIILAIVVKVFDANRANVIVDNLIRAGDYLVGPLKGIFQFSSRDTEVAVNWGIAAALYLIVAAIVRRVLRG
jgi:hypothetical protein